MTSLAAAGPPHLAPSDVLRVAIRYARRGHRVLALRGKRPISEHGARDGTTDVEVIRGWFGEASINLGLCLDGLLVVDVDLRSGGLAYWHDLIRQHDEPETLIQRTGTGGLHYVFPRVDTPIKGKPAPGIDILTGPHRYIVIAPRAQIRLISLQNRSLANFATLGDRQPPRSMISCARKVQSWNDGHLGLV